MHRTINRFRYSEHDELFDALNMMYRRICYCVSKPIENEKVYWRLSHSRDEQKLAKNLSNDATKCIRIIKALFKLETNGLFSKFTSFYIKTAAFYLNKRENWPNEKNLARSIYDFLDFIKEYLTNGELLNYFDSSVNLLENIEVPLKQLANTINGWLKNEQKFLSKISSS
ncbi:cyclic GMP-AMP synthase-like receptor [Hydra vulgaris]|uniref:cyclic GMP-AMP synthase-like receptor n=1 Tax=Hydra vulgaris TaxID=6087 RepID=UPI0032EA1497